MVVSLSLHISTPGSLCALHFCTILYIDSIYHLIGTIHLLKSCVTNTVWLSKKKLLYLRKQFFHAHRQKSDISSLKRLTLLHHWHFVLRALWLQERPNCCCPLCVCISPFLTEAIKLKSSFYFTFLFKWAIIYFYFKKAGVKYLRNCIMGFMAVLLSVSYTRISNRHHSEIRVWDRLIIK